MFVGTISNNQCRVCPAYMLMEQYDHQYFVPISMHINTFLESSLSLQINIAPRYAFRRPDIEELIFLYNPTNQVHRPTCHKSQPEVGEYGSVKLNSRTRLR